MKDYKEETKKSYNTYTDDFSDKFEKHFSLYNVAADLDNFLDLLPDKKLLDLGCGPGFHSVYAQNKGFEVTALDLSEEMVKLAKQKGINAIVGDIEDLPFSNESFDGIMAYNSLLHIPKSFIHKIVDDLANILKSKGVLFVSLKQGQSEELKEDERYPGTKRLFSYYQKNEVEEIFGKRFELVRFITHKIITDAEHPFFGFTFRKL